MNIHVAKQWESFVEAAVQDGRYDSPEAVIQEGLRLVAERDAKRDALRHHIEAAIAKGGEVSEDDIDAAVRSRLDSLERKAGS